jgi:hypothetical protein
MNDIDPLQCLLRQAQSLFPDWQRPERFHEGKSQLIAGIRSLMRTPNPVVTPTKPATPIATPSRPTTVRLTLAPDRCERLRALVASITGTPRQATFQGRILSLGASLKMGRSLILTPAQVEWIRKQIRNRRCGGWQSKVAGIFWGAHPHFEGIVAVKRRPLSSRKYHLPKP